MNGATASVNGEALVLAEGATVASIVAYLADGAVLPETAAFGIERFA